MSIPEDAAERLLACPVGCAFLLIVARDEVPPADAVIPRHAFEIAATALNEVYPWSDETEFNIPTALEEGARLEPLARDLVRQPGAAWWFEPLDRRAQVWLPMPSTGAPQAEPHLEIPTPSGPPSSWAGPYGQLFVGFQATSTLQDGLSFWEVAAVSGVGDWDPGQRPLRVEVGVAEEARVFEVNGPQDWHELCCRYSASNANPPNRAVPDALLVPHWAQVAGDWDGVHLTFAGLLTAPWVEVASKAGRSLLWAWDAEWTLWLRDDVLTVGEALGPTMADYMAEGAFTSARGWSGEDWLRKWQLALPARVRSETVNEILRARPASARVGGLGSRQRLQVTSARGEARFATDAAWEWQLEDCIQVPDWVREAPPRPRYNRLNLARLAPELTTRFAPESEMAPSTELRTRSFTDLLRQLQEQGKLLVTHRSRPAAVLLPYGVYCRLVRQLERLNTRLESMGRAREGELQRSRRPTGGAPSPSEPPVLLLNDRPRGAAVAREWAVDGEFECVRPEQPPDWPEPVSVAPGDAWTLRPAGDRVTQPAAWEIWVRDRVDDAGVPQGEPVFHAQLPLGEAPAQGGRTGDEGWRIRVAPELAPGRYYLVAQLEWLHEPRFQGKPFLPPSLMASYMFVVDVQ